MKEINLQVSKCNDCPYYDYIPNYDGNRYLCDHEETNGKDIKNSNEIPEWCPLPDYTDPRDVEIAVPTGYIEPDVSIGHSASKRKGIFPYDYQVKCNAENNPAILLQEKKLKVEVFLYDKSRTNMLTFDLTGTATERFIDDYKDATTWTKATDYYTFIIKQFHKGDYETIFYAKSDMAKATAFETLFTYYERGQQ